MVAQDKNKYQTPKYRFVVRISNQYVITQVVRAEIDGDKVICSAYSSELPRYGVKVGLKNYAAAYCTGLLCARRLLTKYGLAELYAGNTEVDGNIVSTEDINDGGKTKTLYVAEVDDEKRPFRAFLDVGVATTTTGARVFGALKGASDGGMDIPHNERRFPGYDREAKEYSAEFHRERIFGGHVADYMRKLSEEDAEKYNKQFSAFVAAGVNADSLEDTYAAAHSAIRADPTAAKKTAYKSDAKFKNPARRTREQRMEYVQRKKDAILATMA